MKKVYPHLAFLYSIEFETTDDVVTVDETAMFVEIQEDENEIQENMPNLWDEVWVTVR